MEIRQLDENNWEQYRAIRLDSLLADPGAFASSHEREAAFDEATWRLRLTTGPIGKPNAVFVAVDDDSTADGAADEATAGTATVAYTEHHPSPMLVGMWVRPGARGQQVGERLVDACLRWAAERGDQSMVLWVVEANAPAIALYERCGFEPTGNLDTLPDDPSVDELEMLRSWESAELTE